jgi:hypothetical protein
MCPMARGQARHRKLRNGYRALWASSHTSVSRIEALTHLRVDPETTQELTQPNGDAEPTRIPLR